MQLWKCFSIISYLSGGTFGKVFRARVEPDPDNTNKCDHAAKGLRSNGVDAEGNDQQVLLKMSAASPPDKEEFIGTTGERVDENFFGKRTKGSFQMFPDCDVC